MKKLSLWAVGFITFFLVFSFPLFSEAVYDQYGRLIRSSSWVPRKSDAPKTEALPPVEQEEEILVPEQKSSKSFSTISDRFYSEDDIQNSNSTSLPDFLQQKGFLIMASGGSGSKTELSYKGFTSFCIKVYIDGILANNPSTGEFDWNSIDINSIESIVVSETPVIGISEFAGCCIFITTKGNAKGYLTAETAFSSYETNFLDGIYQSVSYGAVKNNFMYRLGASGIFADNEYNRSELTGEVDVNKYNFSRIADADFSWNAKLNSNWSLSGADSFSYNQVKAAGTSDTLKRGIEKDYATQNNITADYEKDSFKSQTIVSYFYGQTDYLNQYKKSGSDIDITRLQNAALRQNISWKFDFSCGYREEHLFSGKADRHEFDAGLSKEHEWNWFSFTPALQFLYYGNADNWKFEFLPRLNLGFAKWVTLSGFRTLTLPTFNQLYWPDSSWASGNENLIPEHGWTASISVKNEKCPVYARFNYSYYEDKIRWGQSQGKLMPLNIGNADYYVTVLGYEQEVWKNHLVIQADATNTEARLRDSGKQIMWVPEFQVHGSINFKYSGFESLVDYSWTGKRFKENENLTTYPAFHLIDASLGYKINDEFKVFAKGSNLLDEHVVYHDGYYIPSRKWTLGFRITK